MITRKGIRINLNQILAIAEKNLKVILRFKFTLIMYYVNPLLQILLPLIVMNQFFNLNVQFGSWTAQTYTLFLFIGYNIILFRKIIGDIPNQLRTELYWNTLDALMVAPFRRENLLFGIILSHLFLISVPFCVFFILSCIFYPISIITMLTIIGLFFASLMIFAGAGLTVGAFYISNENIGRIMMTGIELIFWISCITYPFELFPNIFKGLISINPVYYLIDILRLTWVENDIFITIISHPFHIVNFILFTIIIPFLGVLMFNYIFKKYGFKGY